MSTERPAQTALAASHDGPAFPWETHFSSLQGPVSRDELARSLVEESVRSTVPAAVDMVDAAIMREELSCSEEFVFLPSRQSNLNKSVNSAPAANQPFENSGEEKSRKIEEKVREFATAYPDRVGQSFTEVDGVSVRRDYADVETEPWTENQPDSPEFEVKSAATGEEIVDVSAIEWGEGVRTLLEKYDRTKKTVVNLEKGDWREPETHAEFSVQAENRWFASYQKKYYGQLDGWLRELSGGERPSGGRTERSFEEPRVALFSLSGTSVPEGERVGPVTHAKELVDAWEPVYHTLRNTLRSMGLELGEDWQYVRILEPHTGKRGNDAGTNEAYAHMHIVVVVDGAVTAGNLRPVVDKHVEKCDLAGPEAHGEEAIEVREPDELNDVAAYVADYCSVDPVELWDREPAYVGFAAAMDAGNIRTVSRSETAREAAQADKCRQRAESEKSKQSCGHGEWVSRELGTGRTVCGECGTAHDIEQDRTLTAHRTDGPELATDGGVEVVDEEAREERLRSRWKDADAAARAGESPTRRERRERIERELDRDPDGTPLEIVARLELPPDCRELVAEVRAGVDRAEPVGFDERAPTWRVSSVTVDGEERPASAGNGIDMVEVRDVRARLRNELEPEEKYRCACGVSAYGYTFAGHLRTHGFEEPEMVREIAESVTH